MGLIKNAGKEIGEKTIERRIIGSHKK